MAIAAFRFLTHTSCKELAPFALARAFPAKFPWVNQERALVEGLTNTLASASLYTYKNAIHPRVASSRLASYNPERYLSSMQDFNRSIVYMTIGFISAMGAVASIKHTNNPNPKIIAVGLTATTIFLAIAAKAFHAANRALSTEDETLAAADETLTDNAIAEGSKLPFQFLLDKCGFKAFHPHLFIQAKNHGLDRPATKHFAACIAISSVVGGIVSSIFDTVFGPESDSGTITHEDDTALRSEAQSRSSSLQRLRREFEQQGLSEQRPYDDSQRPPA